MTEEKKEIKFVAGEEIIPDDYFTIEDKIYGERYFVRKDAGYAEVTKSPIEPVRVHADRNYIMHDPASFVDAVQKYGDAANGIIFYKGEYGQNNQTITMFFDESSRNEKISLPLLLSLEFRSFLNGKEKAFTQKDFLKLLDTFPECISSAPILRPNIEKIQLSTEIEFESNLDPDNLTFIYQEKTGGNQTGRLPKKLMLILPFFEGSENKITIEVDMEVSKPKEDGEKPLFKLINVKHERTEREALKVEIENLQTKLPGWLFVNGKS